MSRLPASAKNAEIGFHRSIQPVNIRFPRPSNEEAATIYLDGKMLYCGEKTLIEVIGSRGLFIVLASEGTRIISHEVADSIIFLNEAYLKLLPYKEMLCEWLTRFYQNCQQKFNHLPAAGALDNESDNLSQHGDENFERCDSGSLFSNEDTASSISHCQNVKVAELESEVLLLKQQLAAVLKKMDITLPAAPPSTSSAPPPPPPPPPPSADFLKAKTMTLPISTKVQQAPKESTSSVPRITDILGDLSGVKLRHVPRSPGGTPCRTKAAKSNNMLNVIQCAIDKRRQALDSSFDGAENMNDSWEEETYN